LILGRRIEFGQKNPSKWPRIPDNAPKFVNVGASGRMPLKNGDFETIDWLIYSTPENRQDSATSTISTPLFHDLISFGQYFNLTRDSYQLTRCHFNHMSIGHFFEEVGGAENSMYTFYPRDCHN
jgi:hypothetical protein